VLLQAAFLSQGVDAHSSISIKNVIKVMFTVLTL
jgi:hypothetical protein